MSQPRYVLEVKRVQGARCACVLEWNWEGAQAQMSVKGI